MGVYTFFRDHDVIVKSGIEAPTGPDIQFTNVLSVFLNGKGGITHVLNNEGSSVQSGTQTAYLCPNNNHYEFLQ